MNIFEYTYADLVDELGCRYGKGDFHAAAIYRRFYREMNPDVGGVPELDGSREFADRLDRELVTKAGRVVKEKEQEGVVKFVTRLDDGLQIESVVLPMVHHKTVCVSSQAGCRMGCRFCETGRNGLIRNLTVAEIVGQVYAARKRFGKGMRNVVFMGM
ncbi:MAG: 23S rRNA (adenine(2503)-C(2))-methyltransferase RlmN, partial [Desulfobacterales bacterium]|nr:23S rRNA (adenine(2503)-C(2))-methyltransferase RlmN [Desulfobacterales bacterium]